MEYQENEVGINLNQNSQRKQNLIRAICSGGHGAADLGVLQGALEHIPKRPKLSVEISIGISRIVTYYQMPVLTLAVMSRNVPKVELVLEHGVDPNFMGDFGKPPLVQAAGREQMDVFKLLLDSGVNVNAKFGGISVLHTLAQCDKNLECIQMLYSHGCSLGKRSSSKKTAIHYAAENGARSIVEWLVAQGVDVDARCDLNYAASDCAGMNGYVSLAAWLVGKSQNNEISQNCSGNFTQKKIFVFNYEKFRNRKNHKECWLSDRDGAQIDSINIRNTFHEFGYTVEIYENLTYDETEQQLENIQRDMSLSSLLIVFLSHGASRNHFYTSDSVKFDFLNIERKFTDSQCPSLEGKSKILMGSFCRGNYEELLQNDSGTKYLEVPRHMLTIYASQEDITAKRHPQKGTIFIRSLCSALRRNPNANILTILDRLSEEMNKLKGTTPMLVMRPPSIANFTF